MLQKVRLTDVRGYELNPRTITAKARQTLIDSLLEFPTMMEERHLVLNSSYEVLGGNQRLDALSLISSFTIEKIAARLKRRDTFKRRSAEKRSAILSFWEEWLKAPFCYASVRDDWDEGEQEEFVVKDNVSAGAFDLDVMVSEHDTDLIAEWGVELPERLDDYLDGLMGRGSDTEEDGDTGDDVETDDDGGDDGGATATEAERQDEDLSFAMELAGDRLYDSDNEFDIPNLLLSQQPLNGLELPFAAWGSQSRRLRCNVATYHFYVDDYRFTALWKDPINLLKSGCKAIVEPNLSCHDQTPISLGLSLIYKKRYLARYLQECGIKVYADLNVAPKFMRYNMMGIPKGYNAFFIRGAGEWLSFMDEALKCAREISGLEKPNLIVYGGGDVCKRWCKENGVLYTEQFINNLEHARVKEKVKQSKGR